MDSPAAKTDKEKAMRHATGNKHEFSTESAKSDPKRKTAEEEIRFRAYQLYLARNRAPGRALEDWLQAEREIHSQN